MSSVSSLQTARARSSRRGRILSAARVVFGKQGLTNGHVGDVARRARVGKATLYREFGSKEHLLLATATAAIDELRDRILSAVAAPGSGRERIGVALRSALAFVDENRALVGTLVLEAGPLGPELAQRYFERYEHARPAASALFRDVAAAPALAQRRWEEIADVLMYLVAGRVVVALLRGDAAPLALDADLLLETFASGVLREGS